MSLEKIATKNVVSIEPKASVQDAAKKMRDMHVGDVIIVDDKGGRRVPIGIITDRDIAVSVVAIGMNPGAVAVEDVMTPALVCAKMSDSLWHLLSVMKEHGVKRLPLVNDAGGLNGIVSSDDIVGLLGAELTEISKIQVKQRSIEVDRRKKFA